MYHTTKDNVNVMTFTLLTKRKQVNYFTPAALAMNLKLYSLSSPYIFLISFLHAAMRYQ